MTDRGFVVTRPYPESNIGSNLASMAGAWWLASRLGRTLVVDWRGQLQLQDESLNYFAEFLSAPSVLAGVPVICAPAPQLADYSRGSSEARWLDPSEARAAATASATADARYLVLQAYHGLDRVHPGPEAERTRLLRSFYRRIGPAPPIDAEIERWWSEYCDAPFVVGVNVRTGNGRYFGKGQPYALRVDTSLFEDRRRFLRVIERACRRSARRVPRPAREAAHVFYATDAGWMSELLAELPNAVTRRTVFPPPGSGDTYDFADSDYSDRAAIADTVADMFLLARCDALVYNSSLFNQYARVVTGWFGGNHAHIETLFVRKRLRLLGSRVRRRLR